MTQPSRRHILAGLAATGLLGACQGTGANGPAQTSGAQNSGSGAATRRLTIGLSYIPDIQFAPFYVAVSRGLFRQAGLDVTLRHHGAGEALTGALQSGTEQVLYAGADEMMQARSQGVDVVNVGTVYRQYPVAAIVRRDSGITSPAQLRGRTIGVPGRYGETWFGLLALLRQAGLSQSDVRIQTIGFTQQAALTTKKVDAVMGYINNEAVRLADAGVPVTTLRVQDSLISIGLNASGPTVESRREDLTAVISTLRKAISQIKQDPAAAVSDARRFVPTLGSTAAQQAARSTLAATLDLIGEPAQVGTQDAAAWTRMSSFMAQAGLVKRQVPAKDAFLSLV